MTNKAVHSEKESSVVGYVHHCLCLTQSSHTSCPQDDISTTTAKQTLMSNACKAFAEFNFSYETERMAFAFNKLKHEEILRSIHNNSEKLGKFLDLSSQVATLHDNSYRGPRRHAAKHLLQYWRHAERLHKLFANAWGCACRSQHCAQLWLRHSISPSFDLSFLASFCPQPIPTHAWCARVLKVEKLTSPPSSRCSATGPPQTPLPQLGSTPNSTPPKKDLMHRFKARYGRSVVVLDSRADSS